MIDNGVVLLHKVLHSIKVKKEESMILKLDMEKAYDRVKWSFLDKFGFGEKWRREGFKNVYAHQNLQL